MHFFRQKNLNKAKELYDETKTIAMEKEGLEVVNERFEEINQIL